MLEILLRSHVLHWYLATTDGGSNEAGARRIIHADVLEQKNVLYMDTTCLEHSHHLVSLSALKAVDRRLAKLRDWRYYASLATTSHVCRDVARQLFQTWTADHGYQSAQKHAKTLWPKACSGRWGGCDKPESRFIQTSQSLPGTLLKVLGPKTKDEKTAQASASVDEVAIEETKARVTSRPLVRALID